MLYLNLRQRPPHLRPSLQLSPGGRNSTYSATSFSSNPTKMVQEAFRRVRVSRRRSPMAIAYRSAYKIGIVSTTSPTKSRALPTGLTTTCPEHVVQSGIRIATMLTGTIPIRTMAGITTGRHDCRLVPVEIEVRKARAVLCGVSTQRATRQAQYRNSLYPRENLRTSIRTIETESARGCAMVESRTTYCEKSIKREI
jgi:hypothetical protein